MKKIALLLITALSLFGFSSKYLDFDIEGVTCDKELRNTAYDVCYSYKRKEALFSVYETNSSLVDLNKVKRMNYFRRDRRIKKYYIANNKCYLHSHKNKGHLSEFAVFDYSYKTAKESFLFSNIVPETPFVNQQILRRIERFIRTMAHKYNKVQVVSGAFGKSGELKCGVVIPTYVYKLIYIPKIDKFIVFVIPNKTRKELKNNKNMKSYMYCLSDFEKMSGIKIIKNK